MEEGTSTPKTVLDEMDEWDSIAALSLIAVMDEYFGKTIPGKEIKPMKTVADFELDMARCLPIIKTTETFDDGIDYYSYF